MVPGPLQLIGGKRRLSARFHQMSASKPLDFEVLWTSGEPARIWLHRFSLHGGVLGLFVGLPVLLSVLADQLHKLIRRFDGPSNFNPKAVLKPKRIDLSLLIRGELVKLVAVDHANSQLGCQSSSGLCYIMSPLRS